MELKEGYKQTELGIIPEDWEVKELRNYFSYISYGFTNPMPTVSSGIYMITANDIKNGIINFKTARKTSFDAYRNLITDKSRPKPNDILLTKDGTLGRLAIVGNEKICINQSVAVIRPNEKVYPVFLKRLLESSYYQKTMLLNAKGSTIKHIYITIVDKMKMGIPSTIEEQIVIAQVLSDTDNLIQAIEQKLNKKRAIKQGAMQQLLTPKEDWEVKKLGDIAKYRRGSFPQPYGLPQWYDENNGTPFVQVFDVDKNMRLKSTTKQKISDLAKDKSVFVQKGNVVITLQGSIGRIAITQYDAYVDRTLLIFTDYKVPMDKVFFAFVIQEKFRIEKENAPGGIIKTITKEELSKFDIPLPKTKDEQTEIATILSDMDADIEQLEQKLSKYKMVKQGLMQNLLTGKIRLV